MKFMPFPIARLLFTLVWGVLCVGCIVNGYLEAMQGPLFVFGILTAMSIIDYVEWKEGK